MNQKENKDGFGKRDDSDLISRKHADLNSIKYFSSESAREEQEERREHREKLIATQKGLKHKFRVLKNLKILGSDRGGSTRRTSLNLEPDTTDRRGMTFGDLPTSSTAQMPRRGIIIPTKEMVTFQSTAEKSQTCIFSHSQILQECRYQRDL